ncbi:MOSC domain-containing protein [Roseobacter sp. YSTF-M11]|uniref:MOSC domain-containing protein n=1 Tax=Roseobacter insulae TaxID=2859783 RepID=A0A9X1FZG6_9RHOB|nr:MOSC domain-containing protein [Roseobacter insulae]MBW4709763.1 MOSC domain-containing protein [Roseobacter insulae]
MLNLKDLIARHAQDGTLLWIGLRPARRVPMRSVQSAEILGAGLAGDHAGSEKRAVTLIQQEHLTTIGSMLGRGPVLPQDLRRNLVIEGLNLLALKGRQLRLGDVVLEITGICAPCSRMEEILGHGGYSAVRGHGGWCARVVVPGRIALGSVVAPLQGTPLTTQDNTPSKTR